MGKSANQVAAKRDGEPPVGIPDWRKTGTGHPMKVWRLAHEITLDDISFLTGLSVASLSRIERYKQFPLISAAQKIINISHGCLRPEDFFTNDNA